MLGGPAPCNICVETRKFITQNGRQLGDVGGTPKSCWFFIPPVRKLTVVKIQKRNISDYIPVFEHTGARVLDPPKFGIKIIYDIQCSCDQFVGANQIPLTNRFGAGIFFTRDTGSNYLKSARCKKILEIPVQNINAQIWLCT